MDAFNSQLLKLKVHIQNEIRKECLEENTEVHNHPPLPYVINNCEYCQKYGNVFAKTSQYCSKKL